VVARNLAHDGTLGFIPKVRSSGSSSLLWSILLAVNWKLFPALNPITYSAVLNGFLLLATGCGLLAMARKDGLSNISCWIWALTPALDGNFVWLGVIGMEHILFVVLSVIGIYLWFQESLRSAILCSLCLGALSLTRPEGLVLAIIALLASRWAHRSRRDMSVVGTVVTLCVLATFLANFITSRSWLPTTYAGRKWLYFGSDKVPPLARIEFPYVLARSLLQPWALHQTHPLYIFNGVIVGLTAMGVWKLVSERRMRTGFLVLWSFIHVVIYSAVLPTRSHGGRYQPLFLALSFPLMLLGAQVLIRRATRSLSTPQSQMAAQSLAVIAMCMLCGFFSLRAWKKVTNAGVAHIEGTHGRMGRFLFATLPPQTRVAAFDIGRIGFLYGGSLVDLGGLTDSSFLPYMREHRIFDYLSERNIQYLVWPTSESGTLDVPQVLEFTQENRRSLTEVVRFCIPHAMWLTSYSVTLDAAPCQTLYQLHFRR